MNKILFLISLLLVSSASLASGWATSNRSAKINFINIEGNLIRIGYSATDKRNPDNCENSDRLVLKDDTKNGDRQYAALLSAFLTKKPVTFWVNGCHSGWNTSFPKIHAVYVFEK